jgi:hypothetical protein
MRALLLLLTACVTDPPKSGGADSAGADTDRPGETDSGGDTDTSDDTADPIEAPPVLTGTIDLSELGALPDSVRLALVPVYFGEGPRVGAPVATATPDEAGAFALQPPLSPPALADQYQVGEAQPLDVSGATYAVLAYQASAPDAPWTDGDPLYGVSLSALLVWLDDTAPGQGWPAGWSIVDAGLAGTYGNERCLLDTEVPLQWATDDGFPVFSALEGPVVIPAPAAPRGLALAPSVVGGDAEQRVAALAYQEVFQGIPGLAPGFDVAMDEAGGWTVSLDAAPPPEGLLNPSAQLPYSLVVPLRYTDDDTSGGWSEGDTTDRATLCDTDGARVMVRHTPAPTSWAGMKLLDCQGGRGGWSAVRRTDAGTWSERLDAAAVSNLRMDLGACSW